MPALVGFVKWPRICKRLPIFKKGLAALSCGLGNALLVKVRQVLKLLEQDGWVHVRTRGSHRVFKHPVKPGAVTVAGKPSTQIPVGTLRNILKQAGLEL